jgi:hypothetical protein
MVFVPPPTATKRVPFQATAYPTVEKILVDEVTGVQVIPSAE